MSGLQQRINCMPVKRIFRKTTWIWILIFTHAFAYGATSKKRKSTPKRSTRTTRVSQPIRSDLKRVTTTAHPVLFASGAASTKKKFESQKKQIVAFDDPREFLYNDGVLLSSSIPQIDWPEVSSQLQEENGKYYLQYQNLKLLLTLNPQLQNAAERYLKRNSKIVSGSTAIIDPQTGRVLALAEDRHKNSAQTSVSSRGPAASLIKIVTSAAAIEKENLDPDFTIKFRGGCSHLANQNWIENARYDRTTLEFDKAFGSSCNTFFARLALYHAGLSSLKEYAEKFMFNKPIPSDIKIQTSLFLLPDPETATPQEIAEAGAGFGATKLSPIHAALMSATVANDGIMMAPYLIEAAYDEKGKEIYRAKPHQIGRVISSKTAEKLSVLMLATTATGTSRGVFHRAGTRANIDDIGGKTGTLLDLENRDLLYTWFSGVAFMSLKESIAIGTVVASQQSYIVKANSIAQNTIAAYAKLQKLD